MTDVSSTDATASPVAKFKIWLAEDGITELGREILDPKHVPLFDKEGNLLIPFQSLKFKKGPKTAEKHFRIFLSETDEDEQAEAYADVRTKGRQPKGSYKNVDNDTVVPFEAPPEPEKDCFVILLDKDGKEWDRIPRVKNQRMRKGCYKDPDGNTVVPWYVTAGLPAPVDETVETPADEAPETPVVAEQEAPPVEAPIVEEPADVM